MKRLMKNKNLPLGVLLFTITILLVSLPTFWNHELMEVFGLLEIDGKAIHFWTHLTSIFEHSIGTEQTRWFLFVHMGTNLCILWIFGALFERRFGTDMFLIESILAFVAECFVPTLKYMEINLAVGASGVVYSYIPLGILCYALSLKEKQKNPLKQWQTWALGILFLLLWIVPSVVSGVQTLLYHLVSAFVGILFMIFCIVKKPQARRSRWVWLMSIPILLVVVLYILYFTGNILIYFQWG